MTKCSGFAVIANVLGKQLNLSDKELAADLDRAAHIYKFDLTTQMVGEFAELQKESWAKSMLSYSVKKMMLPQLFTLRTLHANLCRRITSKLRLARSYIADKLDSIMSFFAVDMIPSGSNDPYALSASFLWNRPNYRRSWLAHLPIIKYSIRNYPAFETAEINVSFDLNKNSDESPFILLADRIKRLFHGRCLRHDIIDAATDTRQNDIANVLAAIQTIDDHKG